MFHHTSLPSADAGIEDEAKAEAPQQGAHPLPILVPPPAAAAAAPVIPPTAAAAATVPTAPNHPQATPSAEDYGA